MLMLLNIVTIVERHAMGCSHGDCICVESTPSKVVYEGDVVVVMAEMFLDKTIGYQYSLENDCYMRVHAWICFGSGFVVSM